MKKRYIALSTITLLGTFAPLAAVSANTPQAAEDAKTTDALNRFINSPLPTRTYKIDNTITVTEQTIGKVGVKVLTFPKDGPYKIRTANLGNKDINPTTPPEVINDPNVAAVINTGFWSLDTLGKDFAASLETTYKNKGFLYFDDKNNVKSANYGQLDKIVDDVFSHMGPKGGNFGAFGLMVKDGKRVNEYNNRVYTGKTARSSLVETKDGNMHIVQNYGHQNINTGFSDQDMYDFYEKQFGIANIRFAYMLDGGGSVFMANKDNAQQVNHSGSFMDARAQVFGLYLTKDPNAPQANYSSYYNGANDKYSLTYDRWKKSKDNNLDKVEGTDWPINKVGKEYFANSPLAEKTYKTGKDDSITVNEMTRHGVGVKIVSFEKNGPYKLRTGHLNWLNADPDKMPKLIEDDSIVAVLNSGFWSMDTLNNDWTKRELGVGKKGLLYFNDKNEVRTTHYDRLKGEIDEIFSHIGPKGATIGAFGLMVKDGQRVDEFKETTDLRDEKTGRNVLIETIDGKIHLFQNYGHSSIKTGFNFNDIYEFMETQYGIKNIKQAFMMDGGGSTFMTNKGEYNKGIAHAGSFIDGRAQTFGIYLTSDDSKLPADYTNVHDWRKDNVSVTYERWKKSKDKNLAKVEGTDWAIGHTNTTVATTAAPVTTATPTTAKPATTTVTTKAPVVTTKAPVQTTASPTTVSTSTRINTTVQPVVTTATTNAPVQTTTTTAVTSVVKAANFAKLNVAGLVYENTLTKEKVVLRDEAGLWAKQLVDTPKAAPLMHRYEVLETELSQLTKRESVTSHQDQIKVELEQIERELVEILTENNAAPAPTPVTTVAPVQTTVAATNTTATAVNTTVTPKSQTQSSAVTTETPASTAKPTVTTKVETPNKPLPKTGDVGSILGLIGVGLTGMLSSMNFKRRK